jgi:hypothetical protein
MVEGVVVVSTHGLTHQGVCLTVQGSAKLQLSARSVGLIEAVYNSVKPHQLISYDIPIAPAGKIAEGTTEIPFEFALEGVNGRVSDQRTHFTVRLPWRELAPRRWRDQPHFICAN